MKTPAAVFLIALLAATPAAACEAEPFLSKASAAMMGAARAKSAPAFSGLVGRYANLREIALFALGRHRAKLPKGREAEYVALTQAFVGRFMAKYSDRFRGTGLKVISCVRSADGLRVEGRLTGGQKVAFKVYRAGSGFKVRDMNIASIWLAQQLRSTFGGVIRRNDGDIGALFRYLKG